MANAITSSNFSTFGTIDTTAASGTILVRGAKFVDLSLDFATGTFVGSIAVQRQTNTGAAGAATWNTIETHTAATERVLQNGAPRNMRLNVTVTSGTLGFELTAGNKDG